tara:strand:+ start:102 stop:356 length:255 start_codon:yes stop_codon:yes gene_type:complete
MKTQEKIEQLAKQYWDKQPYNEDAYVVGYTQCQQDMANNSKVTRFEVIDENGRVYSKWNCNVELSYQDDGKTLKVFIKPINKQD